MDDLQSWFYRGLLEGARDPFGAADRLVASAPLAGERACAAGCAHCCSFAVGVSAPEIEAIEGHLRATRAPADLAALRARVQALPPRGEALRPCVLLDEALRCTVYAVRPVACRGWTSTSQALCAAGEPAADPAAFAACAGVHEALRARGDGRTRELTEALGDVLADALAAGAP